MLISWIILYCAVLMIFLVMNYDIISIIVEVEWNELHPVYQTDDTTCGVPNEFYFDGCGKLTG